jgi:para-aminobenzoate synthetase/4-amino-4-deoxychorismate lyase
VSLTKEKRELEPLAVFESFKGSSPRWDYVFDNPLAVYEAQSLEQVLTVIQAIEREAQAGRWIVLMLAYEAAPAFDAAMQAHALSDFPFAWAAVFDKPKQQNSETTTRQNLASVWEPQVSLEEYARAIQAIRRHIENGDTYQVNFTFPFKSSFAGDAYSWFRELGLQQEAEYCAYLNLGRYKIISLSPELFFERRGNRFITRPMKGTMPRGLWLEEDEAQAERLAASIKNRAENLMIVDLLRNDLGKISDIGTVKTSNLFAVERFRTILQMTSTIEAVSKANVGLLGTLQALFPCGSITGAPKISTMEIIHELEKFPRQAYTGTIGIVKPGGDCIFNVAIRSIVLDSQSNEATFNVGGGITYDSTVEDEFQECLLKANFLNQRWREFEIFETMLLEDGEIFLLERHLLRQQSSAKYFAYDFDEAQIRVALQKICMNYQTGRWKVRLFLFRDGTFRTTVEAIKPQAEKIFRVKIAAGPVDSKNVFLYHKTTNREVYERAFEDKGDCDEVILWNEKGEITESTIANLVWMKDGEKFTPPQSSGLLCGTFRQELLATGQLQERVIRKEELLQADEFFLINSVRKWIRAAFVS